MTTLIDRNSDRGKTAQKLLDIAHEFWKDCNNSGQYGGVQWLTADDGSLIIFTRGEYRHQLLSNIPVLSGVHAENMFSENIFIEDGE